MPIEGDLRVADLARGWLRPPRRDIRHPFTDRSDSRRAPIPHAGRNLCRVGIDRWTHLRDSINFQRFEAADQKFICTLFVLDLLADKTRASRIVSNTYRHLKYIDTP
jgi:hypothetical protein